MGTIIESCAKATDKVRDICPLVHCITNYVTVNDVANCILAIGASPIMADDIAEAADITSISKALVINMGTLNARTVESMVAAGKKANELGVPVVFDPVGADPDDRPDCAHHLADRARLRAGRRHDQDRLRHRPDPVRRHDHLRRAVHARAADRIRGPGPGNGQEDLHPVRPEPVPRLREHVPVHPAAARQQGLASTADWRAACSLPVKRHSPTTLWPGFFMSVTFAR